MILACLFALAAFLYKSGFINSVPSLITAANEKLDFPEIPNSLSGMQARFRDTWNADSFPARTQVDLRLPHGPNPQQKYIQEMKFFDNPYYQQQYKEHLKTAKIDNQHWKLDVTTNGVFNNYAQKPHQPEDNIKKIGMFSELNLPNNNSEFFFNSNLIY